MKNTIPNPNPNLELEYALDNFSDYTHSAFLVSALHWAEQHGFWQPFVRLLSVPMKRVVYTPVQKVQTLMASIMIGCKYNKDVNFRLVPDEVAASALGMARFPDQSQLNLLLVQGVAPRVVMEILGHSKIAVTMDIYSHVLPAMEREAANKMETLLFGS
jgi:hypothetical protein